MIQPLDGPSKQYTLSAVGTVTVVEVVKPTENALEERKVVTIQPLDGTIRVYFAAEGEIPSAATVSANGFRHFKNSKDSYEASNQQVLFVLAESGTSDVIIAERA